MADIYAYVTSSNCYLSNTKVNSYYSLRGDSQTLTLNRNAIVELTDGKFIFPENARNLFYGATNMSFDNMDKGDTSQCTNMERLFYNCRNLRSVDFYNFDTSNVTKMESFLAGCTSLTTVDLSHLNTSSVTNAYLMFDGNTSVTNYIGLNDLNFSNCTTFQSMFSGNESVEEFDISKGNTSSAICISGMFASCTNLKKVILGSKFKLDTVSNVDAVFDNDINLEEILVPEGTDGSQYSFDSSIYLFRNCSKLPNWDEVTDVTRANTDWYFGIVREGIEHEVYLKQNGAGKKVEVQI